MRSIALLSMHSCPVDRPGQRNAGGMNVYLLEVARQLGGAGLSVDIYTRAHGPEDSATVEVSPGARVIHVAAGSPRVGKQSLDMAVPEFAGGVLSHIDRHGLRYDIIHSHYWLSGLAGMEVSCHLRIPHVATFHTLAMLKLRSRPREEESQRRIDGERTLLEAVDGVVVSTREEAADLARLYGVNPARLAIVPPGVNLELFKPQDRELARKQLGLRDRSIVLYVGRLEPLKGVDILIRAIADLHTIGCTQLLIAGGDTTDRDERSRQLLELANSLGVGDQVTFVGSVAQSELPVYYGSADVLVLPSHYESFGMVALEAMACGTPVVVSRVGGLPSFVKNGECGYLVPWRCEGPFAERIGAILSNPALGTAMGLKATAVARGMSWADTGRGLLDFYGSLVARALESD